jgi:predicted MFS family arabinose efflux permease
MEMVGKPQLPNAVALNSMTFNLARIVGPALAGVLIAVVGTGWVFLGNAVFTIAVIVGLALMRTGELFRSAPTGRTPGQLREGLRYVKGRSDLVLPMVLVFVIGTFGLNYPVTMALLAKEVFGRGAAGYGLFTTAIAVGSLGGALMSTRRTAVPRTRLLLSACFAFGFIEVLVSLMPTYWSTVAMLLPMGAAALTFTIAANSTVQLGSAPAFRGRVMALYMMCFTGGTPIGAPLVGVISDAFGARAGVLWSGGISALAALGAAVVVSRRRGVRLRTQVGQVLPHPSLRLRWAATAEPAGTGAPAGIAADTELVADRRRAS